MLREFVVKLLGTEEGADEVLRRAWERLEAMTLPHGQDARATLLLLAESEVSECEREGFGTKDAGSRTGSG